MILKLVINLPTDNKGLCLFRSEFAKLQTELVLENIRTLNIPIDDREKILELFIDKIKERLTNNV